MPAEFRLAGRPTSRTGPPMSRIPDTVKPHLHTFDGGRRRLLTAYLPSITLCMSVAAVLLIVPAAAHISRDYGFFTRDPTQIGNIPRYAGYLSSLGVMAWTVGATVSLFTSAVLVSRSRDVADPWFFLFFGALTALLGWDDLFLIHENFFLGEKSLFLVYGAIALTGVVLFRGVFRNEATGFAQAAAAAFLLSLSVDAGQRLIERQIGDIRILIEDGAKFIGAVCWAIFLCKIGAASISRCTHE